MQREHTHISTEQRNTTEFSLSSNSVQYLVPLFSILSILKETQEQTPFTGSEPPGFFFSLEAEVSKRLLLTLVLKLAGSLQFFRDHMCLCVCLCVHTYIFAKGKNNMYK